MDEVKQRLREGADQCYTCYEAWRANEKNNDARAALQDAVHELRKIASRIEIDLAISERNEMAQKPIPIPPHRDARGRHQGGPADMMDDEDGNARGGLRPQRGNQGQQHRRPHTRGPRPEGRSDAAPNGDSAGNQ